MKKVLSIFLSLVMMFSIIGTVDLTAVAASKIYNRPTLSEASAMDFLQFLYNEELDENKIRNSKYFPLLTGKFTGTDDEYEAESIAFSIFVRTRINELVENSEYNLSSSYDYLYNYLSSKLESSKDLPQEIIDELKGTAMKKIEEGILDLLVNCVADTTDIIVTEEHISWINAIDDGVNKVNNLADQVTKYIEYTAAAIQGCRFVLAKEQQQRYWYFSAYLNNRDGYSSSSDEIFKALDDCNFEICATNSTGSFLIDSLSWITKKDSWVNHREIIQEWAEFVYQVEKFTTSQVISQDPIEYNGHTYQVFDISKNWIEAKEYCESIGGHLVTITNSDEQNFIGNLVKTGVKSTYWLGGNDELKFGVWEWITGEVFSYTNWATGEPTNGYAPGPEYYLEMIKSSGKWNDGELNGDSGIYTLDNHGFICEWDNTYSNIIANEHENESHNHIFKTEVVEPTCAKEGYTKYSCEICHYFYIGNYTSALGHDYKFSRIANPTCTEKGYDLYTCARCGKGEKIKYVDALGHTYSFAKTVAPTCAEQGYDLYTCSRCNGTERRNTVTALGHSYGFTKTVAPNCSAQGYDLYTCSRCNGTEKRNYVNALGHQYVLSNHSDPTCNTVGYDEYKCSVCQNTKKNEIAVLDGSALTTALTKAQTYLTKDYFTQESMAELQTVYSSHKDDLDRLTTQVAVDGAVTEINNAISNLVLGDFASGVTDDGFQWSWEKATGRLTVTGDGEMKNYGVTTMPWYDVLPYTTEIILSEGITSIGNYAFYKAETVEKIHFSNTLTSIGMRAFEFCSSVEEIVIPDTVTSLGYGTFASMTSLKKVTVPASTTYRSYCFDQDRAIEEIIITYGTDGIMPDSKVTAEQSFLLDLLQKKTGAFGPWRYARNAKVIIEDGVTNIGNKAFYQGTGITSIRIPDTVTTLGANAFQNCTSLNTIALSENVTNIGTGAFDGCDSLNICGYINSYTQTFAAENSIPFVLLGDSDGNGEINSNDYAMLKKYVTCQRALTEEQRIAADFNGDGAVDAFDVIALDVYLHS